MSEVITIMELSFFLIGFMGGFGAAYMIFLNARAEATAKKIKEEEEKEEKYQGIEADALGNIEKEYVEFLKELPENKNGEVKIYSPFKEWRA